MAALPRQLLLRVVTAAAAGVVAVSLARQCEGGSPAAITVELDVTALAPARSARVELWRGPHIVASLDRRLDGGLTDPIRLTSPPLGDEGEVRVVLDTGAGTRRLRRPLIAPAGSAVVIRLGEGEGEP